MATKTIKEKIRKCSIDSDGYCVLILSKNGKPRQEKMHRLVANAFIPNPYNKPQVNHKDGNKHNNNVENLEWVTSRENSLHAYNTGLNKPPVFDKKGQENSRSKIVVQLNKLTMKIMQKYYGTHEASRQTGIKQQSICACCNNKIKEAGGYIWRYA